jgi:RHS repeat-associated protein
VNGTATDFVLDNGMLTRELKSGTSIATYLIGARGPEYKRNDSTGTISWYVYDGLGSVLEEVDQNGNVNAYRKYDVYASVRSGQPGMSRQRFVGSLGHQFDDETGLIYMRARYVDPVLGRFVSEDPGGSGNNWFTYCSDNPVNFVDKDGKVAGPAAALIIGLTTAIAAAIRFILGYLGTADLIHDIVDPGWTANITAMLIDTFGSGVAGAAMAWVAQQLATKNPVSEASLTVVCSAVSMAAFIVSSCVGSLDADVEYWTSSYASN